VWFIQRAPSQVAVVAAVGARQAQHRVMAVSVPQRPTGGKLIELQGLRRWRSFALPRADVRAGRRPIEELTIARESGLGLALQLAGFFVLVAIR
jgi:hypothetical protein